MRRHSDSRSAVHEDVDRRNKCGDDVEIDDVEIVIGSREAARRIGRVSPQA